MITDTATRENDTMTERGKKREWVIISLNDFFFCLFFFYVFSYVFWLTTANVDKEKWRVVIDDLLIQFVLHVVFWFFFFAMTLIMMVMTKTFLERKSVGV